MSWLDEMEPEPHELPSSFLRRVERLSVEELRVALVREAGLRGGWQHKAQKLAVELSRLEARRADGE